MLIKGACCVVNAIDLAEYVIQTANEQCVLITHLKLQKILYYIAGIFAAVFDKPAFHDKIEAWQYGPVVRSVYVKFCSWGALPLTQYDHVELNCTKDEIELINFVIQKKLRMTGRNLVNATHGEAPWKKHKDEVSKKPEIEYNELLEYFKRSPEVEEWKAMNPTSAMKSSYSSLSN